MSNPATYNQLIGEGYCVFPQILPADLLAELRAMIERLDAETSAEQRARYRSQGSMFPTTKDPLCARLIALPAALQCLADLGFDRPSFSDGWIISKPGRSPRLFWHYDWFAWEDPRSYASPPPQIFLMCYLNDTTPENGCLRVIPGSHLQPNVIHELLREPHSKELSETRDYEQAVEFATRPDEIDVPVQAGDLLIGDARLLHATHANQTDERRTVITLWFQPDLGSLPERIQAQMAKKTQHLPTDWPPAARALVEPLLARYSGDAIPYARTLWRPPLESLVDISLSA